MSESARRRRYRADRVLIQSDRILDPQFSDAALFFSGSQIELMRNMTQYLNRLGTYAKEYNPSYYLTPDAEDWDTIQAIVADLEDTLMGNPNTLWGYSDRFCSEVSEVSIGDPTTIVDVGPIPAGYVYVVEHWKANHDHGTPCGVTLRAQMGTDTQVIYEVPALPSDEIAYDNTRMTLKEGDRVRFTVVGLGTGKTAELTVSGYTMVVPS